MKMNKTLEYEFRSVLKSIGENPDRQGIRKTAKRAAESFKLFASGYKQDLSSITSGAIYNESSNNMVVMKDIEFYSLCEHHLLPFFGKCHIGYVPCGKVMGLSKLPKIVEMYSRRLQIQERITSQIAEAIEKALKPKGVAVVMEGIHTCMMIGSADKYSGKIVTSSVLGSFARNKKLKDEFMRLAGFKYTFNLK